VAYETLRERIDKLAVLGTLSLEFTGGEPLLQPRLFDSIRHATHHRHRFFQRKMITNAYPLNVDKVKQLNDAGLSHPQISLDGVETNDMTVKVPRRRALPVRRRRRRRGLVLVDTQPVSQAAGAARNRRLNRAIPHAETLQRDLHRGLRTQRLQT
jgi:MoaA/NifB/PqqE/SkfB family radical SAM enzyme